MKPDQPPKNPCPGIRLSMQYIDPPFASRLLATNPEHQRSISTANLRKIEQSIREDKFYMTGQPVIVDENGRLLDGQHRLQAVVNTGIGIWTVYVGHVPAEYFKFMDCGKARTFSDVLKTTGHGATNTLAATVTRLAEYLRNPSSVGSAGIFAHSELLDVVEAAPRLDDAIRAVAPCKHILSASQIAWLYYLAREADPEKADYFFRALATGDHLLRTSPIFLLRLRIINDRAEGFHPTPRETQALLIKAWNLYMEGKQIKQLKGLTPGEAFPVLLLPKKQEAAA